MDVNQWYENPNVIDLDTHSGEIMGNTGAQDLLEQNGASAFRLGDVDGEDDDGGM
jgi:hypothetical protein